MNVGPFRFFPAMESDVEMHTAWIMCGRLQLFSMPGVVGLSC